MLNETVLYEYELLIRKSKLKLLSNRDTLAKMQECGVKRIVNRYSVLYRFDNIKCPIKIKDYDIITLPVIGDVQVPDSKELKYYNIKYVYIYMNNTPYITFECYDETIIKGTTMRKLVLDIQPSNKQKKIMEVITNDLKKVDNIIELLTNDGYDKVTNIINLCTKKYMGLKLASNNMAHNHIRYSFKNKYDIIKRQIIISQFIVLNKNSISLPIIGDVKINRNQLTLNNIKRVTINEDFTEIKIESREPITVEDSEPVTKLSQQYDVAITLGHIISLTSKIAKSTLVKEFEFKNRTIYRFDKVKFKDNKIILPILGGIELEDSKDYNDIKDYNVVCAYLDMDKGSYIIFEYIV